MSVFGWRVSLVTCRLTCARVLCVHIKIPIYTPFLIQIFHFPTFCVHPKPLPQPLIYVAMAGDRDTVTRRSRRLHHTSSRCPTTAIVQHRAHRTTAKQHNFRRHRRMSSCLIVQNYSRPALSHRSTPVYRRNQFPTMANRIVHQSHRLFDRAWSPMALPPPPMRRAVRRDRA